MGVVRTLTCVGGTEDNVFVDVVSLDNGMSQRHVALPRDGRRMCVSRSRDERTSALVTATGGSFALVAGALIYSSAARQD